MKLPRRGKVLAIQIGEREIRVASLLLGGKMPQIQQRAVIPTPRGAVEDGVIRDLDALGEALRGVCRRDEFARERQAVFVLSSSRVIAQTVSLPAVKSGRRLAQMLEANADLYVPVEEEAYQLTWQVVGRQEVEGIARTQVQLWGIPKELLGSYYRLARSCGLQVAAIDFCGHSFARSIGASYAFEQGVPGRQDESAVLYLQLEEEYALLSFVAQERILLQRLLRRGGTPQEDWNDIFMEIECFRAEFPACAVETCMAGGVEDKAFLSGLEELTGLSWRRLCGGEESLWHVCLGAGRTELDFGDPALDPRSGRGGGSHLQPVLLGFAALLMAGSAALYFTTSGVWEGELQALRQEYLLLDEEAAKVERFAENYRGYAAAYDAYQEDLEALVRHTRTYNDSACLVLEELEGALPADAVFTKLDLDEQSLTVEAAFQSKEDAARFLIGLRNLRYVSLLSVSDLQVLSDIPVGMKGALQEVLTVNAGTNAAMNVPNTALIQLDSLTEQDLQVGLARLEAAEDFVKLDNAYAVCYEEWTLNALLKEAALEQRQMAVFRLLNEDAFAFRWFSLLAREGDVSEEIVHLVKDERAVEDTEELIKTNASLRRKLAEMLAVELGEKADYKGGLDYSRLRADILSGKTKSDAALNAVVRKLLPADALEAYDALQPVGSKVDKIAEAPKQQEAAVTADRTPTRKTGESYSLTVTMGYRETLIRPREDLDTADMLSDLMEVAE